MLKFACYGEKTADALDMDSAFAFGADGVAVRADLTLDKGVITCAARTSEPIGLAVLWPVKGLGSMLVETTRLQPSDKPYNLHVELARCRLMNISLKREEWGLFDYPGIEDIATDVDKARDAFVEALEHQDEPQQAAKLADKSLGISIDAAERLSRFHASVFLTRRQKSGGVPKRFLGVSAPQAEPTGRVMDRVRESFSFIRVPVVWRDVQPKEADITYDRPDAWIRAAVDAKLLVRAGPLLHFGVRSVPDWMYIWENDYESILDYAREHVRRTIKRYGKKVNSFTVASGLHAGSVFDFTVEQIIDLTRMTATVAKQLVPRTPVILELTQPWGEYYARNQRTIPPLLYADMVVQSGVTFDAFGLQFLFGHNGYHVRDLFKISSLIDRLANLGKPLHVTAVACPSGGTGTNKPVGGGTWHGPWTDDVQADWLKAFLEIALSKPYVESICLSELADGPDAIVPSSGILRQDLSPKPAAKMLQEFRQKPD